jgi:hypothetical protein
MSWTKVPYEVEWASYNISHGDLDNNHKLYWCIECGHWLVRCACGGFIGELGTHFCHFDPKMPHEAANMNEGDFDKDENKYKEWLNDVQRRTG